MDCSGQAAAPEVIPTASVMTPEPSCRPDARLLTALAGGRRAAQPRRSARPSRRVLGPTGRQVVIESIASARIHLDATKSASRILAACRPPARSRTRPGSPNWRARVRSSPGTSFTSRRHARRETEPQTIEAALPGLSDTQLPDVGVAHDQLPGARLSLATDQHLRAQNELLRGRGNQPPGSRRRFRLDDVPACGAAGFAN